MSDDPFELLGEPAQRVSPRRAGLVAALLLACAALAAWAWGDLRQARLEAARANAERARSQHEQQQAQAAGPRSEDRERLAILGARSALAAVLSDLERCHPAGARVISFSFDSLHSAARFEAAAPRESDLQEWGHCLNDSVQSSAWTLSQFKTKPDPAAELRVVWSRDDRRAGQFR